MGLVFERMSAHAVAAMSQSRWVIDVGDHDFETAVLERSKVTPVVVDFWAPWCGPCRTLGPLLERLADEHRGAFMLAKVNVDEAPAVAQAFNIQGIPAVKGFRDGMLVAEFVGAQPETTVRKLLELVLPTEADRLVADAAASEPAAAEPKLTQALELEPRHAGALVALARLLGARGDDAGALRLLELVSPPSPLLAEAERLAAELRMRGEGAGDEPALRARVAADPDDLQARLDLGRTLAALGRHEGALAELLAVVQRDRTFGDDAARKAMVDVFAVLGSDHPLTERYRGELAKALFR
jgi:putative thioredoxin